MTSWRPSCNSFHSILQKVSTAPVGTPSDRVKLRPRLCAALNIAKYARKINDDPSIRKTWSPFFSLRGVTAVDMGLAYVWRRPRHTTPCQVRKACLGACEEFGLSIGHSPPFSPLGGATIWDASA